MFTSTVQVEFSPLPVEKEDAYWMTLNYFAEVILKTEANENISSGLTESESNGSASTPGN